MISVVIPVYNGEEYVKRCIDSVLSQTYTDYEMIVVNDGSSDSSEEIIKGIKSDKIKYIYQENKGAAAARTRGILEATGEYLFFLDSDDAIREDTFSCLVNRISGCDMVIAGMEKISDNGSCESVSFPMEDRVSYSGKEIAESMLCLKIRGYTCGILYKREIWDRISVSYTAQKRNEDWLASLQYVYNSEKIEYVDKPLYCYYQRDDSLTHTAFSDEKKIASISDYNIAVKLIVDYIEDKELHKDFKDAFKVLTQLETAHEIYMVYPKNVYGEMKKPPFNRFHVSSVSVAKNKVLSIPDKLKWILWNLRLYSLVKKILKF